MVYKLAVQTLTLKQYGVHADLETQTLKHGVQTGCSDTDTEASWCICGLFR